MPCLTKYYLGRDSWVDLPERTYRDVSDDETVVTFKAASDTQPGCDAGFARWVDGVVSLVEVESDTKVVVRHTGDACKLPNALSWLTVELSCGDGMAAEKGLYYVKFFDGWSPNEMVVEPEQLKYLENAMMARNFMYKRVSDLDSAEPSWYQGLWNQM